MVPSPLDPVLLSALWLDINATMLYNIDNFKGVALLIRNISAGFTAGGCPCGNTAITFPEDPASGTNPGKIKRSPR